MMIRLTVIALALGASTRTAEAGPYCGQGLELAPADGSTLPVGPTIGITGEDSYYDGERYAKARRARIRAKIDGKRVAFTTREVRSVDGIIRFVTIKSRRAGKLELWVKGHWTEDAPAATYQIVKDWTAPAKVTVALSRGRDDRLQPYRRTGELAVLRADAPVIAFSLRWRRDRDDAWRVRQIPASIDNGSSEARLGQTMCGMVENVPLAFLEQGIEAELTGWLPDGRQVSITEGVPNPLVIPPRPPTSKRSRDVD